MKLTAFTKIIVTLAITAWVFILPVEAVATILVLQLALLLYIKHDRMTMAAIGGLAVFTGMMILLQLLFGSPVRVPDRWSAHAGYDHGLFVPLGCHPYSGYCQGFGGPLPHALRVRLHADHGAALCAQLFDRQRNHSGCSKLPWLLQPRQHYQTLLGLLGCDSSAGYACGGQVRNLGSFHGAEGLWQQYL